MTQKNTKGAAVPRTTAPDNAGEGIKEIAGHITETFVALMTTAIWFVAISSVSFDFPHMYFPTAQTSPMQSTRKPPSRRSTTRASTCSALESNEGQS